MGMSSELEITPVSVLYMTHSHRIGKFYVLLKSTDIFCGYDVLSASTALHVRANVVSSNLLHILTALVSLYIQVNSLI